jgi:hypothetical protein
MGFLEFGSAVDLEGDKIVVGAPYRKNLMGAVYVFDLDATKVWKQTKIIEASDGASGDLFGGSVALLGNFTVVGAPTIVNSLFPSAGIGAVYVYDGLDFEETKLLQGNAKELQEEFGYSVAIFNDTVVVGAPRRVNGACYILKRNPTDNSWSRMAKLTSSENNREGLGRAVTYLENFVVAGAPDSNLAAESAGAVYVFEFEEDVDTLRTCLFPILCK